MLKLIKSALIIGLIALPSVASTKKDSLKIYLDADFSNHFESSNSIVRGLKVALKTVDFKIKGRNIQIVRKDHRGNSARSERHIKQFMEDPNGLLMMSGIHSPPLLAHRKFINENKVLFLVPWAAAAPITRFPSAENWIFRLSIDDSKAGKVIVDYAVKKGVKKPFLLLEKTGWGKSNEKTISSSLRENNIREFKIGWFDWNMKTAGANALIGNALNAKSDAIILVANAVEGKVIFEALISQPKEKRLPIYSHWGIIGGDFHKQLPHKQRRKTDLRFIQTKFSFIGKKLDPFEQEVFSSAKKLFPEIQTPEDILAPTGFIHAFDLGILLIEASRQVNFNDSISSVRESLRRALENIKGPIRGLVKVYKKPFSKFSKENLDAHEALGITDFTMARFGPSDEIILEEK
ncbi:MAG: hypothetical protein CL677_01725 [Bdellovibrionaceae bacterium]|nr:hypothetical protein [Pseudobdellovibrionaceae bacterium]|tara:strand:- start:10126 stop:11343 length:1218 start_codon:yes stop_codon:yes gene_type:complete